MAPLVALAGFMGSGKSSVGARAPVCSAGGSWISTRRSSKREGMPIAEFFARHGEPDFRRTEVEALKAVLSDAGPRTPQAQGWSSLSGRHPADPEAAALLEERGRVVFLDVDADQAWERARGSGRPLAQDRDAFTALLAARRPTYEQHGRLDRPGRRSRGGGGGPRDRRDGARGRALPGRTVGGSS